MDSPKMIHRVMIVGCPGAGKTTLAKKIQDVSQYELITLDEHYYSEHWTEPSPEAWIKTVTALTERPKWIMDGNYSSSMNIRLEKADMVVFLDHPTVKLLWRVLRRTYRNWGKTRPGMPAGCPERFDLKFIKYVLSFNRTRRVDLMSRLQAGGRDKEIYILSDEEEIERFVDLFKTRFAFT